MNRSARKLFRDRFQRGGVRIVMVGVLAFLVGIAVGGYWYHRTGRSGSSPGGPSYGAETKLSETTSAVLRRLNSPVEVRFYSLLDPASVSESTRSFAARVEQLLAEYELYANGMIRVVRVDSMSRSNAEAAASHGIQPFNLDKGSACFLGIIVVQGQQSESLPHLSPDWEPAVEWDLSRAIVRVTNPPTARPAAVVSLADTAAVEELRRIIPNLPSVSAEEGTRLLREAALTEFADAANEMERQVAAAQQALSKARAGGSEGDRQAAMKELQRVQAEHSEKLKRVAQLLQDRTAVLERIKGTSRQPADRRDVRTGNNPP